MVVSRRAADAMAAGEIAGGHARGGVDVQQTVNVAMEARVEGGKIGRGFMDRARDAARVEADEAASLPGEDDVEGVLGAGEQAVDKADLAPGRGAFHPVRDEGDSEHPPDQRPQARHHRGEGRDVAQEPEGRRAAFHGAEYRAGPAGVGRTHPDLSGSIHAGR